MWLTIRRWWREFWSGRQNGMDGFHAASEFCATANENEVALRLSTYNGVRDRYDIGYCARLVNELHRYGWSNDRIDKECLNGNNK